MRSDAVVGGMGANALLNFFRMEKCRYTKLKVYLTDIRPNDTPNALRHTVNSVTEARCGFCGAAAMPPTPKKREMAIINVGAKFQNKYL